MGSWGCIESTGHWEITWRPGCVPTCKVHGLFETHGVCSYNPLPTCSCPFGFDRNDHSYWSKGCSPLFNLTCDMTKLEFIMLPKTVYFGYDLDTYGIVLSFEVCRNACLTDCRYQSFGYKMNGTGECFPKRSLLNGYKMLSTLSVMYIKVPRMIVLSRAKQKQEKTNDLNCSSAVVVHFCRGA